VNNGTTSIADEISKNNIKQSGASNALELFYHKYINVQKIRTDNNSVDYNNFNHFSSNTDNNNNDMPLRKTRIQLQNINGEQPLKDGWLMKKRFD
jgi:hypothetical protein